MAISVFPQAIQYDNTATSLLKDMADNLRREKALEAQLKKENQQRRTELLNMIDPTVLSKTYNRDAVNSLIGNVRGNVAKWLKDNPNGSNDALQMYIYDNVGKISEFGAKIDKIQKSIESSVKELGSKRGIDTTGLSALALTRALKKPDGSLKGPEELNADIDWVADTYALAPEKFINVDEVGKEFDTTLRNAQKRVFTNTRTVQKGRLIDYEKDKVEILPWQEVNAAGNVVTKKDGGYISEDIFESIVPKGSLTDVFWTKKAKDAIESFRKSGDKKLNLDGVSVDDPGNVELVKRALVTGYVDRMSGFKREEEKKDIARPAPIVNVNTGSKDVPVIDVIGIVSSKMNSDKRGQGEKYTHTQVNTLPVAARDAVLDVAKSGLSESAKKKVNLGSFKIVPINGRAAIIGAAEITNDEGTAEVKPNEFVAFIDDAANISGNKDLGQKSKAKSIQKPTAPATSGIKWKK